MSDIDPTPEAVTADFHASVLAAIELLKRGAQVVDLFDWNLRIRLIDNGWAFSAIPQWVKDAHAQLAIREFERAWGSPAEPGHHEGGKHDSGERDESA